MFGAQEPIQPPLEPDPLDLGEELTHSLVLAEELAQVLVMEMARAQILAKEGDLFWEQQR